MMRTHLAGRLSPADVGTAVVLAGWVAHRRDHGGVAFLDLRDSSGLVQAVLAAGQTPPSVESCVLLAGVVRSRPAGNANPELPTGEVEVVVERLEVLGAAEALPLPVDGPRASTVSEEVRLRYRYLDLRRAPMARALRLRSALSATVRRVLAAHEFVEVETPCLTRSTPEGARDFLVPVRLQPGSWYALPQSPQLFKQLLMVAGTERYFQIARCFRDEDFRSDRQPEFTQLDIEMSFVDETDVMALAEELTRVVFAELAGVQLPAPLPRLTWHEAMTAYGSDKPDLRCPWTLVDLTTFFADTTVGVFRSALDAPVGTGHVGGLRVPGGAELSRKELDSLQEWARTRAGAGLAWVVIQPDGQLRSPLARHFSAAESAGFAAATGAVPGDAVFLAAGLWQPTQELLGALRVTLARDHGALDESAFRMCWVVEAPMFAREDAGWTAVHHPFTAPTPDWAARFDGDPGHALSRAYDLVCNGSEIAGGSIRIHSTAMQQRVFDVIGLSSEAATEKFGFLLEALRYGAPPHAGIAFGFDRLAAILAGVESIRDVIAFPKTASGSDPLTGAPTPITAAQRREAGVDAPGLPG